MLQLYYHPLASFCHKALIALYEKDIGFERRIVNLLDPEELAEFQSLWPVGKMPVLRDLARNEIIPETSIIIEYLDRHWPDPSRLLPTDPEICLQARLWDRFFDLYVQDPMQRIVGDRLRPEEKRDQETVADWSGRLMTAYGLIEGRMADRLWMARDVFSIADCAAAPALFYAHMLVPFPEDHSALVAYFERLLARPSFARVLVEARPYFDLFPFRDRIPRRFLEAT